MPKDAVRPSRPRMPPLPQRVLPEVISSDPGLSWINDDSSRIRLEGIAMGRDGAGAELSLSFDGARVSACVSPGTTASQAVDLLEKALPEGYRLSILHNSSEEVVLELIRSPNAPRPPQSARSADTPTPFSDALTG
jgi:hypothetical protein